MNVMTMELQRMGVTISVCRDASDSLLEAFREEHNIMSEPLFNCKIRGKYISSTASTVEHPEFETAVTTILKNNCKSSALTEAQPVKNLP